MTLSVATPGPDPITTLENGLKIIRLAEYIGAARGTLSVVSDPLSVAGTVVKEEQAVAPPSTFASQFASVSDSVTIPVADFDFPATYSYAVFMGLRCEGSTPANGRAGEFWNYFNGNNTAPTVRIGFDGSPSFGDVHAPTSIYEHYSLLSLGGFIGVSATDINIRAWGLTNVADPMAWYLDVMYLVPLSLAASDESNGYSWGSWAYWLPQPVLDISAIATDEVPIDIGRFSVLSSLADGVFQIGTGIDLQESNEENTEFDWNEIFFNEPERETSWITIVGCGSRLIKPQTLETIDFSDTTGTPQWGEYLTSDGYVLTGTGSGVDSEGWAAVSGQFLLRGSGVAPPAGHNFYFYWALGQRRTGLTSTFVSSDPRTYSKVMGDLESFVMTMKCTLTDGYPTGASVQWAVGAVRYTPSVPRYGHALVIEHKTDGTSTAKLASRYTNNESPYEAMDTGGVVSVLGGLSGGGSYWIKVERRFYHWRAKVWLDGDPEPGSWTLEAHESTIFSTGSPIKYPYTTGWAGSPSSENFPVTLPMDSSIFGSPWTPGGEMVFLDGCTSTHWHFAMDDITVEYDPDPAPGGAGDYTGAYFHIEKYDGSEDWGTAYISPGALQVLYTDYARHHFGGNAINGTDQHGGNFMAWKETGGKLLQGAAYSQFYFRRSAKQPQWGDIKYP